MAKHLILIVEDDPMTALDLESVISDAFEADVKISRSVAVAMANMEQAIDLAVLDVDVTNGKTFVVAAELIRQHVPCLFVSGSKREEIPAHLQQVPFMTKPFNEKRLVQKIREMLPA